MNSFTKALQNAVDKVTGTSRINNLTNPNSAAYKMQQSVGKVKPFKPRPVSNGIGVGP